MPTAVEIKGRLETVFERAQARVLTDVIVSSYEELVKTGDFNELKGIVRELAQTQNRTEIKVEKLVEAQNRLTEAQNRTEGEIQKLTKGLDELRIEVGGLSKGLKETRGELGGLSRSFGYAFENEAYRMLPGVLSDTYQIHLKEKLIRTEIGGKEINILGKAKRNGQDVLVIGETKVRLDERRRKTKGDVFKELEEKVSAVKEEYEEEVVKVLITHYATKGFMKKAKDKGVIVVQSFQW